MNTPTARPQHRMLLVALGLMGALLPATQTGAVDTSPYTPAARLVASEAASDPSTIQAVAISADGSTLVVGAPETDNGDRDLGSAYVFQRAGPSWLPAIETATLTTSDASSSDALGTSVAVSADGSTIVVGAPLADAIYVYVRPPAGWSSSDQTAQLTASIDTPSIRLGEALAISADGSVIAAGAPGGSAGYVFVRPAAGWASGVEAARLTASDAGAEQLGAAVSISADGSLVALGAPLADGGGRDRGAVLLYVRSGSVWSSATETATLSASDAADASFLGTSVALSADSGTLVAGATGARTGSLSTGAAYVFTVPATGWASGHETARLAASDVSELQLFGASVAASANGSVVAVGAPGAGPEGSGAASVFSRPAAGWAPVHALSRLTAADPQRLAGFGADVDMSDDGLALAVGAPLDHQESGSGATYVFAAGTPTLRISPVQCLADGVGGVFALQSDARSVVRVASLNPLLAPDNQLTITPAGPGRYLLNIRAMAGRSGAARITISAGNGLAQVSQSLTLRVGPAFGGVLNGTIGPDLLVGGSAPDTILGRGGADLLCGRGGADTLLGNEADDVLDGSAGADTLLGGDGDDTLTGGLDADAFRGGAGVDHATDLDAAQGDTGDGLP